MRVVVPHTEIHPATQVSLDKHLPAYTLAYLDPVDESGYWRLLCSLWAAGEDFAIIEHDMGLHGTVYDELLTCKNDWCTFPYTGPPHPMSGRPREFRCALGCTRFRTTLMAQHPDIVTGLAKGHTMIFGKPVNTRWDTLDSQIASRLFQAGHRPCEHTPWVTHHHDYETNPIGLHR